MCCVSVHLFGAGCASRSETERLLLRVARLRVRRTRAREDCSLRRAVFTRVRTSRSARVSRAPGRLAARTRWRRLRGPAFDCRLWRVGARARVRGAARARCRKSRLSLPAAWGASTGREPRAKDLPFLSPAAAQSHRRNLWWPTAQRLCVHPLRGQVHCLDSQDRDASSLGQSLARYLEAKSVSVQ